MERIYAIAALWIGLGVLSTIIAYHIRVSIALVEICIGIIAATIADRFFGAGSLGSNLEWLRFLSGSGAILLTFLAGADLDPKTMSEKKKEVLIVGFLGFLFPFLGCTAVAKFILNWGTRSSWLAGVSLSTTSMAVVYAVMLESGLSKTGFGKGILGACFINDIGTVVALGLLFAPFTYKTIVFVISCIAIIALFPRVTTFLTNRYGNRTAAIRAKWVILVLFGLGAIATWSGSEAVLPAYIAGMVLAEFASKEHQWIRRLRTLTVGFLTPFYFIRAGSLVSLPSIVTAPVALLILFLGKAVSKILGLYPVISQFYRERSERWFYTLMMSTGLTFGTISALYGLSNNIITQEQYSFLVAAVIASAVIPTIIANFAFFPKHYVYIESLDEEDGSIGDNGEINGTSSWHVGSPPINSSKDQGS